MAQFKFTTLEVTPAGNSIILHWGVDTKIPADKLSYEILLIGENGDDTYEVSDPLQMTNTFTFSNLKANTDFSVFIRAYEEPGHTLLIEYPTGGEKVSTGDGEAPTAKSTKLAISYPDAGAVRIQWERAFDDVTAKKDILYKVFIKEADDPGDNWSVVQSQKNIVSYTVSGLRIGAQYIIFVQALDEAGNALTYDCSEVDLKDDSAPIIKNKNLRLMASGDNYLSVEWDKATDNVTKEKDIRYSAMFNNADDRHDSWHGTMLVGKTSHTFKDLKPGTKYNIRIEARDQAGNISPYTILQADTKDTEAPTVSNPAIRATSTADSVTLEWVPASDNFTDSKKIRYVIIQLGSDGKSASEKIVKDGLGITSCTIAKLSPATRYTFKVEAYDEAGNCSPYSSITAETKDNIPPTVKNKAISAEGTADCINLKWTPATDNVTPDSKILYKVYQDNAGAWKLVEQKHGITSVKVSGLASGTRYTFKVIAYDEAGNSLNYDPVSQFTKDVEGPRVANMSVRASEISQNSFKLSWDAATDNVSASNNILYKVYLKEASTTAWSIVTQGKGITSYNPTGLKAKTTYSFYVQALDESNNPVNYSTNSATTTDSSAPTLKSSTVRASVSQNSITLSWDPATDNVTASNKIRYIVYYRSASSSSFSVAKDSYGYTSHQITGLKAKTTYYFYVKAMDESGNVVNYSTNSATTTDSSAPTLKSSAVRASVSQNSITLSWDPATDNVTASNKIRYIVYYRPASSSSFSVSKDSYGYTSHQITGLKAKTTYYFYVRAIDESGNGINYATNSATTPDTSAPTLKSSTVRASVSQNSITLSWDPATDNVSASNKIRYIVYYRPASSSSFSVSKDSYGYTSHQITGLKAKTTYYFYVRAIDESGNGINYATNSATTTDTTAPTVNNKALRSTIITDTSITVAWDAATDNITSSNNIRYKVYFKEGSASINDWRVVKDEAGLLSYKATGLKPSTSYDFYVIAYDQSNNSVKYLRDDGKSFRFTTKIPRINRIDFSITQGAEPLRGTNSVRMLIEYTYYDANGRSYNAEWKYEWSNKSGTTSHIQLPANCYFKDNKVEVILQSRLTKVSSWCTNNRGMIDITKKNLKFKLGGYYLRKTVCLEGSASDGYSRFI